MGWLSGWTHRKKFTVDQTKIDAAEISFATATISADSVYGTGYEANKAVDGNTGTLWASDSNNPPHWWKVDFGSGITKTVSEVRITPWGDGFGYGLKDFIIQGSNDNSSWTDLYTDQHANNGTEGIYTFGNTTAYRYYRIYCTSTWRTSFSRQDIAEIRFFEHSLFDLPVFAHLHSGMYLATDLTTGKTATADTVNGSEVAANAIDNNTSTFWTSATSGTPPRWLKVDLGSGNAKIVGKYTIMARTSDTAGKPTDWKLQGSNDDSNWTDLHTISGEAWADDGPHVFSFNTNSTAYRYYRLYITATSGGHYVQIKEFELFEFIPANTDFSKFNNDLSDLRFTAADGTTLLKHEVDELVTTADIYGSDFLNGGTAYASEGTAANAVDNNTGTLLASGPSDPMPHWFVYDLGAGVTKMVRKFRINPFSNVNGCYVKDWGLYGSNVTSPNKSTDTDWTLITTGQCPNVGQQWNEYTFANSTAYRWYKVKVTSNWRSFTDYGINELEMMELTSAGGIPTEAFVWVKLPSVSDSADTDFYMYYQNMSATDGSDKENVWDAFHKGVWHLPESGNGTSGEFKDSTSNHNHGTAQSTVTKTTGLIGSGQDFNSSRITIPDSSSIEPGTQNLTWSFKVKFDTASGNRCFIGRDTNGTSYFYFAYESTVIRFRDYNGGAIDMSVSWSPSAGVWYDIEVTRDGSTWKIFVNNSQVGSSATSSATFINRSEGWVFGGHSTINYNLDGQMDEIRMSFGIARSDAWRKARINSDNETLMSLGSEESHGPESLDEGETINLSDHISLQLTVPLTDSITLADEASASQAIVIDEDDAITLSDQVDTDFGINIHDTVTVADEILTNVSMEEIVEEETVELLDEISVISSGDSASFGSKIISFNPLVIITDTTPMKIVRIDITDPENPMWEIFSFPGITHGRDAVYNATFNCIYIACADGKILQVDADDFNTYAVIDTEDANDLLNIESLDAFNKLYAGTGDATGEVLYIDQALVSSLATDIQVLERLSLKFDMDIRAVQGGILSSNIQCLQTDKNPFGCDIRVLADSFDEVAANPIKQIDFHVYINGVEMQDVDLSSIKIYHAIGEKSTATFDLHRRHDEVNLTVSGSSSQITNQNTVEIYIQSALEFTGKTARVRTDSENERVEVTAIGSEKGNERRTIHIPLASLNEKLHPYHCLVDNEDIYNPYIDPNDPNPEFYSGVQVDLGTKTTQNISRYQAFSDIASVADAVISGTFQPKQNWTYFWFASARNFLTGITQGSMQYVGTSPASLTSDIWDIIGMSYWYQRQFDDVEIEQGIHQLGSAPYKEISSRNGKRVTKDKWVDQADGLYRQRDEGYDFTQYAKDIAALEYRKLLNINGDILPKTSCDIDLMVDGYYFYGIRLLTRINIDNTTTAGIYSNSNGFPVAVKTIQIDSGTMHVSMKCDNELSDIELQEIDALRPNDEDPKYKFPAQLALISSKFDYGRFESVE